MQDSRSLGEVRLDSSKKDEDQKDEGAQLISHCSQCDGRHLCNSEELKSKFRANFIAGLKRLHEDGKLKLAGECDEIAAAMHIAQAQKLLCGNHEFNISAHR